MALTPIEVQRCLTLEERRRYAAEVERRHEVERRALYESIAHAEVEICLSVAARAGITEQGAPPTLTRPEKPGDAWVMTFTKPKAKRKRKKG